MLACSVANSGPSANPITLICRSYRLDARPLGPQQRRLRLKHRLARPHLRQIGWVALERHALSGQDRLYTMLTRLLVVVRPQQRWLRRAAQARNVRLHLGMQLDIVDR